MKLDGQIDSETDAKSGEKYRQKYRVTRIMRARDVRRWQTRGVTPVLKRSKNHASRSDEHQDDANHVRESGVKGMPLVDDTGRCSEHAKEQAKPCHDEAEGHDGEPRAHPGEERTLGGKEDSGGTEHGGLAGLRRSSLLRMKACSLLTVSATLALPG